MAQPGHGRRGGRRFDMDTPDLPTARDYENQESRDDANRDNISWPGDDNWDGSNLEMRPIWSWSEVQPGTMVYLRYYLFWHAVLVTDKDPGKGTVRGIHYAVPWTIFSRRVVREDEFRVNLSNKELWVVRIPEVVRVSGENAVKNGRSLIGEQRFNMFTSRSRHMVLECILKRNSHAD